MRQYLNQIALVLAAAALVLLAVNPGMSAMAMTSGHNAVSPMPATHDRSAMPIAGTDVHHHAPDVSEHCAEGDRTDMPHQCKGALCPAGLCSALMGLVDVQLMTEPQLESHSAFEPDERAATPSTPLERPPKA